MTPEQFESGIARLIGNFSSGSISQTLVSELSARYFKADAEDWNALIGRVLANCKTAPRFAHFRELEQNIRTYQTDSERRRKTCGLCSGGFRQRYARAGVHPYAVLIPCPCSPELIRSSLSNVQRLEFITREEYEAMMAKARADSKPARMPKTKREALEDRKENDEERKAIRRESIAAEVEEDIRKRGIPPGF